MCSTLGLFHTLSVPEEKLYLKSLLKETQSRGVPAGTVEGRMLDCFRPVYLEAGTGGWQQASYSSTLTVYIWSFWSASHVDWLQTDTEEQVGIHSCQLLEKCDCLPHTELWHMVREMVQLLKGHPSAKRFSSSNVMFINNCSFLWSQCKM